MIWEELVAVQFEEFRHLILAGGDVCLGRKVCQTFHQLLVVVVASQGFVRMITFARLQGIRQLLAPLGVESSTRVLERLLPGVLFLLLQLLPLGVLLKVPLVEVIESDSNSLALLAAEELPRLLQHIFLHQGRVEVRVKHSVVHQTGLHEILRRLIHDERASPGQVLSVEGADSESPRSPHSLQLGWSRLAGLFDVFALLGALEFLDVLGKVDLTGFSQLLRSQVNGDFVGTGSKRWADTLAVRFWLTRTSRLL